MDTDFIVKLVTATVAVLGALLGILHFSTTRRSVGYQNSKTEMELLSQSIAAHEAEPDYKKFLTDVRKEKISFLVFGVPIPNADLERVTAYYREAEGKVTAGDIARAWRYRDPSAEQLSFRLHGNFKAQYIVALVFVVFCMFSALGGIVALTFKARPNEAIALACVSLVACFQTIWMNQGSLQLRGSASWRRTRLGLQMMPPNHACSERRRAIAVAIHASRGRRR